MAVPQTIRSETLLETIIVRPPIDLSEALREELLELRNVPGWISAAVTRRDGLAIQHTFSKSREANTLCAMAAAIVGSARTTGDELRQGPFNYSVVRYLEGLLLVMEAGPEAILACLFARGANLGLALLKITQVAKRIEGRLEAMQGGLRR
jgi:predicted regulator of Ras-like GTPase activity (Roadblock/LC7/MglB family)